MAASRGVPRWHGQESALAAVTVTTPVTHLVRPQPSFGNTILCKRSEARRGNPSSKGTPFSLTTEIGRYLDPSGKRCIRRPSENLSVSLFGRELILQVPKAIISSPSVYDLLGNCFASEKETFE